MLLRMNFQAAYMSAQINVGLYMLKDMRFAVHSQECCRWSL